MDIDEILTGNGSPVSYDFLLYMFQFEGLAQKRVIQQIKLRRAKIVGGPPVGVHLFQIFVRKRQSFLNFHRYLLSARTSGSCGRLESGVHLQIPIQL